MTPESVHAQPLMGMPAYGNVKIHSLQCMGVQMGSCEGGHM